MEQNRYKILVSSNDPAFGPGSPKPGFFYAAFLALFTLNQALGVVMIAPAMNSPFAT
jgi:hypothetical protein